MGVTKSSLLALLGKPDPSRASSSAEETEAEDEEAETEEETSEAETEDQTDEAAEEETAEDEDEEDGAGEGDQASRFEQALNLMSSGLAEGRGKLAKELASDVATGRMSAERAQSLLKAAPKTSSLSAHMSGKDKGPGQDKPSNQASDLSKAEQSLLATAQGMKTSRRPR
ncbi:hypothetical protein [Roseibium suaedae]|uniref:Uncharacterized protein n=1 Tax=Roseibium suaedae TaxID=735517 RepID=A0A1M7PMH8_9HYPH|nr:hypothetical protein [Roseibium suaedae]SHN18279.1 hypothetical protein SAMN05444272_4501 [Roseibium suaedae]